MLLYVIFWFYQAQGSIISVSMLMALGLMVLGTHMVQNWHGKGFLLQPIFKGRRLDQRFLTNQTYYRVAIELPVFRAKCFSCHNPQKKRSGYDIPKLSSEAVKRAPIWKPGDAGNSLILQNIHLAIDEKKHILPMEKFSWHPMKSSFLCIGSMLALIPIITV